MIKNKFGTNKNMLKIINRLEQKELDVLNKAAVLLGNEEIENYLTIAHDSTLMIESAINNLRLRVS